MKKEMIKRIFMGPFIGIGNGIIISLIFNYINSSNIYYATNLSFYNKFDNHLTPTVISFACFAIIGIISNLASMIYDIKNMSIFLKTLMHIFIIYLTVFIIGKYLHWFGGDIYSIILNFIIFSIIYLIIWVIFYLIEKKEIEKINKKLKDKN
ncbi:DUF3021 family protein [Oceanivirga salmonicida]|uniref:DUF3021 family protein n=1 Tax=Oceanivirga salmonicida TaxID=1769291 RepID=UPI00082DDA62|nr:DUF3021 family protein [Oceanivirga salmonicida]